MVRISLYKRAKGNASWSLSNEPVVKTGSKPAQSARFCYGMVQVGSLVGMWKKTSDVLFFQHKKGESG